MSSILAAVRPNNGIGRVITWYITLHTHPFKIQMVFFTENLKIRQAWKHVIISFYESKFNFFVKRKPVKIHVER